MNWKLLGIILASLGGTGGVYAAGDHFGFRPAYISEVREVTVKLDVVASSVGWLDLDNFKKWLAAGNRPTPATCAKYKALAKRLGASPPNC